jgi:hypothetical protein
MKSFVTLWFFSALLLLGISAAPDARAGILINAENVGSDVHLSWTGGSWDVSQRYNLVGNGNLGTSFAQFNSASTDYYFAGPSGSITTYSYTGTGPSFNGSFTAADSGTAAGGSFRLHLSGSTSSWEMALPQGYISGAGTLAGSAVFPSTTIATLFRGNLNTLYSVQTAFTDQNGNTLQFQAVPEPSASSLLLAGGLTAVAAAARRRRNP